MVAEGGALACMGPLERGSSRLSQLQQRGMTVRRGWRLPPQAVCQGAQLGCADAAGLEALQLPHVFLRGEGSGGGQRVWGPCLHSASNTCSAPIQAKAA